MKTPAQIRALVTGLSSSLRQFSQRVRNRLVRTMTGGRWTDQLPNKIQHNLRAFWLDGLFANASQQIIIDYNSIFVLALGATRGQIGLMTSLTNLTAALMLLPGAFMVERWGHRKDIVCYTGGVAGRITLLLLALTPIFFSGQTAVAIAIGLTVLRAAMGNLANPAWTSLTADIVPLKWRGRYFSARNIAMSLAGMTFTYLAGQIISWIGEPTGYQWAFALAFGVGMLSTYFFSRIRDRAAPESIGDEMKNGKSLWARIRAHPKFIAFCGSAVLWNFSLQIAGPFFNVYLVEELRATAAIVGTLSVIASLAALPGQRLFGRLSDRWGSRRVQVLSGLFIPLLPVSWILARSPWHVAPIRIAASFLWAGYNLANFNALLTLTPQKRRARYTAVYNVLIALANAGGAALGGVVADTAGYTPIFVMSGVGRLLGILLFIRFVRQPETPDHTPEEVG